MTHVSIKTQAWKRWTLLVCSLAVVVSRDVQCSLDAVAAAWWMNMGGAYNHTATVTAAAYQSDCTWVYSTMATSEIGNCTIMIVKYHTEVLEMQHWQFVV
eukprot:6183599-Pleurochrysis_carterae.AAC.2